MTVQLFYDVVSKPLFKGISLKRAFDFSFIPMERKPISYIRERWSPFGVFGVRRTIAKRDLTSIQQDTGSITSVTVLPPGHVAMPYLQMTPRPPSPVVENPEPAIFQENNDGAVLKGLASFPNSYSLPPTYILIGTPKAIEIEPPPPGLHTDISRAPLINNYLNSVQLPLEPSPAPTVIVENVVPPAPSEIPPVDESALEENSIFPKSKMVLHFGNVFLKLVSQFFANARYSLGQLAASRATS